MSLSADILIGLLFKKQRRYIFCWGRAKSENVPSTPGVAVVENQGFLHGEEGHRLFQKIRGGDSIMEVFFEWQLQFLHLAETLPFQAVEFTPAENRSYINVLPQFCKIWCADILVCLCTLINNVWNSYSVQLRHTGTDDTIRKKRII